MNVAVCSYQQQISARRGINSLESLAAYDPSSLNSHMHATRSLILVPPWNDLSPMHSKIERIDATPVSVSPSRSPSPNAILPDIIPPTATQPTDRCIIGKSRQRSYRNSLPHQIIHEKETTLFAATSDRKKKQRIRGVGTFAFPTLAWPFFRRVLGFRVHESGCRPPWKSFILCTVFGSSVSLSIAGLHR